MHGTTSIKRKTLEAVEKYKRSNEAYTTDTVAALKSIVNDLHQYERYNVKEHSAEADRLLTGMFGYGLTQEDAKLIARGIRFALHNLKL